MRIIELPLPLCPDGKLALAILVERPTVMHNGHVVWLGNDYDFDGSTPPESYQMLDGHGGFAKLATVVQDYGVTQTLDFVGLKVAMLGADQTLEEQSGINGLSNDLLVFFGNEIASVIEVAVESGGYRLKLARGRYSTLIESHASGEAVHIISRDDILALTHPTFQPGATVTFKVALSKGRYTQDLSEVEPIEIEMSGKAFAVAPSNLRINGEQRNATFAATTDVKFAWSLPDMRALFPWSVKTRTKFEIVSDVDDSVLWSKLTYASTMKITGAKMDLIRGAETSFTARISTDVLAPDFRINSTPITLNAQLA